MRAVLFLFLFMTFPLFAATEFVPIQEMAQAHSLAGASQLNDSLYTNPAGGAFTNVYSVEGAYLLPKTFGVSVLDTKTSTIGGGLAFFRKKIDGYEDPMQGAKLALLGKAMEGLGLGIAGKMIWGPRGTGGRVIDLDAGLLANFSFFQLGITVRNIAGGSTDLGFQREWATGGRIGYQDTLFLSVASTSIWNQVKPYEYGIGAEYVSPYYFSVKGGYRFQPVQTMLSYWSAGVSLNSPRLSVHYAIEFPQQKNELVEHMVGAVLLL